MMLGDEASMLKILFDRQTRKLLVRAWPGTARELKLFILARRCSSAGGSVEYFRDIVFNYPTVAEAYKVAALDGLNKL